MSVAPSTSANESAAGATLALVRVAVGMAGVSGVFWLVVLAVVGSEVDS